MQWLRDIFIIFHRDKPYVVIYIALSGLNLRKAQRWLLADVGVLANIIYATIIASENACNG